MFYYVGTVILRMSPKEFWHCLPRKLDALSRAHIKANTPTKKKRNMTIDGVPVSADSGFIPNSQKNGVGVPNAYVDQLKF